MRKDTVSNTNNEPDLLHVPNNEPDLLYVPRPSKKELDMENVLQILLTASLNRMMS